MRFSRAVLLMVAMAAVVPASGQTLPQAAPASLPPEVAVPLEPKAVVEKFMIGILSGDEKAVFENMTFTNEESRREAEVIVGEALVQQQLDELMANLQAEKDLAAGQAAEDRPENRRNSLIENLRTSIAKSEVVIKDDAADVMVESGPIIYLLRVGGAWKIDFEKTQRTHEGAADKTRMAEVTQRIKVYKDLMAEIRQGKFSKSTAKDVNAELLRRMSLLPPPKVAAEERGPVDPKRKAALAEISNLKAALAIFEIDNVRFPTSDEGLAALVKMPARLEKTWHKYMDAIPKDPWGNEYEYRFIPRTVSGPERYDLISHGPDGRPGTADDLNQNSK